ncbi:MAG TPA: NAD(P)-dependent oxidoreductase [Microscillaceae bacterium]|nr:NAD(P)-dependent oxidoreductase [Microscillaceae bacterium]
MKITFIGLGIMGSRMAKNLLKNKIEITVYNRTRSVAETLAPLGAKVATTAAEAVQDADIVFTMLAAPKVVESVAFGAQGFLQSMQANALWVDCSTVSPAFSLQAAEEAKKHQVNFVEAPVAGTKPHAENAELVFFCGGEANLVDQAKPYMEMMGKKVVHLGGVSKGTSLKILVNYILAQGMLAFAEAAVVGEKIGLDRSFLLDFLPNLPVAAPFLKPKAEKLAKNDGDVQFPLELMHKDVGLFASTAEAHGITNLSANASKDLYQKAIDAGLGRDDFSAIYNALLNRFLETEAVK